MEKTSLATIRTILANRRTFLAYCRTGFAFIIGGLAIIHYFDSFHSLYPYLGILFVLSGVVTLFFGINHRNKIAKLIASIKQQSNTE